MDDFKHQQLSVATGVTDGPREQEMYVLGWNSALEMAAFQLTHNFTAAFGEDTLASVAAYIKELKK